MLQSVIYVALQRVLQHVSLLFRSADSTELEIVVLRHELAILRRQVQSTGPSAGRSMLPGGGQPTVAARQLVGVSGHAGDAHALASLDGGQALDLRATAWSSADRQGASSADRSLGTGESAVGPSAHCGRAEGPRHGRIGHHGQEDPARGRVRSGRQRSLAPTSAACSTPPSMVGAHRDISVPIMIRCSRRTVGRQTFGF